MKFEQQKQQIILLYSTKFYRQYGLYLTYVKINR